MPLKVLIVDDSFFYRQVLAQVLKSLPDVDVVGSVATGAQAVSKVKELKPDLVTLDIEMPGMNGLEVMNAFRQAALDVKVLVISSVTVSGGRLTLQALQNGAFDFITKPSGSGSEENFRTIREELSPRLLAMAHRVQVQNILRNGAPTASPAPVLSRIGASATGPAAVSGPAGTPWPARRRPEVVVIGVSTGGPNALATVFASLPGDLGAPILIVQHMPPIFTQLLAANLSAHSSVPVREACQDEAILPGTAYLAPGGKHMRLAVGPSGARILQLTDDPPENSCRPAVDYLFRSVADTVPGKSLAVILTGMGDDGTAGLRRLKQSGCISIAQDEASCVVFGMPKAAIDAGVADIILPLDAIADRITRLVRGTQA